MTATNEVTNRRKPLYKQIYFWVLVGIALGILVGYFFPATGEAMEPVGQAFVNLIKMVIAPVMVMMSLMLPSFFGGGRSPWGFAGLWGFVSAGTPSFALRTPA